MTDDIDDLKRGGDWHRELHPNPIAYGKLAEDYFETELKSHDISYIRSTDAYREHGGDDGWDFKVDGLLIDIKTSGYKGRGEILLLVEEGHIKAHFYVLYSKDRILGFATNKDLKSRPPHPYPARVVNHVIPEPKLRDINILWPFLHQWVRENK